MFGCFKIIRVIIGAFLSVILFITILVSVSLASVSIVLTDSSNIKKWIKEGEVYGMIDDLIVEQVMINLEKTEMGEAGKYLEGVEISDSIEAIFEESWIQENTERVIDAIYAWMRGETEIPEFEINILDRKDVIGDEIVKAFTDKFEALPLCSGSEIPANPEDFNLFTTTCKPPGFDESMVTEEVNKYVNAEGGLSSFIIKSEDIKIGQDITSKVQQGYSIFEKLPIIIIILVIIVSFILFVIIPGLKNGILGVGIVWVLSSVSLIFGSYYSKEHFADIYSNLLGKVPVSQNQLKIITDFLEGPIRLAYFDILKQVSQYGIIIVILGGVLVFGGIILKLAKKKYYIEEEVTPSVDLSSKASSDNVSKVGPRVTLKPTDQEDNFPKEEK